MCRTACRQHLWLYSTDKPLLTLWRYGLYTASVPVQYSYTSNPPMGCTACIEPQCLYKGVLFFYLTIKVTRYAAVLNIQIGSNREFYAAGLLEGSPATSVIIAPLQKTLTRESNE